MPCIEERNADLSLAVEIRAVVYVSIDSREAGETDLRNSSSSETVEMD